MVLRRLKDRLGRVQRRGRRSRASGPLAARRASRIVTVASSDDVAEQTLSSVMRRDRAARAGPRDTEPGGVPSLNGPRIPSRPRRRRNPPGDQRSCCSREVHDPGIGFVTLTRVKVSPDLQLARVYYTLIGDDESASARPRRALERATPFLRRQIGSRIRLRRVPELRFQFDESVENQDRIERILLDLEAERKHAARPRGGRRRPRAMAQAQRRSRIQRRAPSVRTRSWTDALGPEPRRSAGPRSEQRRARSPQRHPGATIVHPDVARAA